MTDRREITALTCLRGAAAWWVVFYHADDMSFLPAPLHALVRHGNFAVDLFFVMSGFVLARSYGAAFRPGAGPRQWAWFMLLRLGRVYPVHLIVLLLYLSVPTALALTGRPLAEGRFPPGYFLESLVLVQNWGWSDRFAWNLPAWSISTEMLFYIVFPAAARASSRIVATSAGLVLLGGLVLGIIFGMGWGCGGLICHTPRLGALRCLAECGLGVWLHHAVARFPPGGLGSTTLLAGAAALAWLYAAGMVPDYVAFPLAFACLLAAVTHSGNLASRTLSLRLPMFLGRLSFATYMVHYLVKDWVKLLSPAGMSAGWSIALYVSVVLAAAAVLHRLVEVPGRLAGRRIAARFAARSASAADRTVPAR